MKTLRRLLVVKFEPIVDFNKKKIKSYLHNTALVVVEYTRQLVVAVVAAVADTH